MDEGFRPLIFCFEVNQVLTFLYWYVLISYLLGFVLFAVEMHLALKREQYHLVGVAMISLLLAPLTTWHGVLHWLAVYWHRMRGTKFEPWI